MAEVKNKNGDGYVFETATGHTFKKIVIDGWSSHPESLKRQRKWLFLFGLVPVLAFLVFAVFALSGFDAWKNIFIHPGVWMVFLGSALALSLGAMMTAALLNLICRASLGNAIKDKESIPFSRGLIVALSLFWLVPFVFDALRRVWGVGAAVPAWFVFALDLACFAPLPLLLLWLRVAKPVQKGDKPRLGVWFLLGLVLLGTLALALLGDVQGLLARTSFGSTMQSIRPSLLRVMSLATLLPLALVCFSVWHLFWSVSSHKSVEDGAGAEKEGKSFWRRLKDWLSGFLRPSNDGANLNGDLPPPWLDKFIKSIRDDGDFAKVKIGRDDDGKPQRMEMRPGGVSKIDKSEDADTLWLMMGHEDDLRPTEGQTKFFRSFQDAYKNSLHGTEKGKFVPAAMVLSGETGVGRTETLIAIALYSAFARGQRVLFVAKDVVEAEVIRGRLLKRIDKMLLSDNISCELLSQNKVSNWLSLPVKELPDGLPNIVIGTPRSVENAFFCGTADGISAESVDQLARVIQSFRVILVDDYLEMEATERAHFTFVLHKLNILIAQGRALAQVVLVTPDLTDYGVGEIGDKIFGKTNFNSQNVVTLCPRECPAAWELKLEAPSELSPNELCRKLVGKCLAEGLDVVLYRKGLPQYRCVALAKELSDGMSNGKLRVISSPSGLDGSSDPDVVFFLSSLTGDVAFALRLNMGGGETVFIAVTGEDLAEIDVTRATPAIPDASATSLCVYHLKSLLRFVARNTPLDVSIWDRFGVVDSLPEVEVAKSANVFERWALDKWNEPEKYGEPLDPYVVLSSRGTASTAGFKIDFSVMPMTNEGLFKLADSEDIVMGTITDKSSSEDDDVSSLALWPGSSPFYSDLSHIETFTFCKSADGEVTSGGDGVSDVYTVDGFRIPGKNEKGCRMVLSAKRWNGDGTDYDTPVRSLSWRIEAVAVPDISIDKPDQTVLAFSFPECRGQQRRVTGVIKRLVNFFGDENIAHMTGGDGQRGDGQKASFPSYDYKAYVSALVLLPRSLDDNDKVSQIQTFTTGVWDTADHTGDFSPVLSHLFAGVMQRIIPDFQFFACCPVFRTAQRADSIGDAIIWVLQPVNSGRTVTDLLKKFFLSKSRNGAIDASFIIAAMRKALGKANARPTLPAKLRWLRSYSRSAFEFDLAANGNDEILKRDFAEADRILSELESRLRAGAGQSVLAPSVSREFTWMSRPRSFSPEDVRESETWVKLVQLPDPKGLGLDRGGNEAKWSYANKSFSLEVGFSSPDERRMYLDFLNGFQTRVSTDAYAEYGYNDPYRRFVDSLYVRLRDEYDKLSKESNDEAAFAEYILFFLQSGLDYIKDPKRSTDWPRFPSETCVLGGGDCEDTSILYADLLRRARIGNAVLSVPKHAAVGVAVKLSETSRHKSPIVYSWQGVKYVYAETAMSIGRTVPLGSETSLIKSADELPDTVTPTPLIADSDVPMVCILNVDLNGNSLKVWIATPDGLKSEEGIALLAFARDRKYVYDEPAPDSYQCLGGVRVPGSSPMDVLSVVFDIQSPSGMSAWWIDVFACRILDGGVVGHFVGAARLSRG